MTVIYDYSAKIIFLLQTFVFMQQVNRKTYVDSLHNRNLMKSTFITVIATTLIIIATPFVITQQIQAQAGNMIITYLSGKEEVPPTKTYASAWAKFQEVNNGSQIVYSVSIIGLNKITGAHLHEGVKGQNGDVVAVLAGNKSASQGNTTISFKGNITKDDLQGPFKGKEVSELISRMKNSSIYVNVPTDEYKDGAIRGQIG
jgi:CHRD domain-containing protein